jgi:hypothetical protein
MQQLHTSAWATKSKSQRSRLLPMLKKQKHFKYSWRYLILGLVIFFLYGKLACYKFQWFHISAWDTRSKSQQPLLPIFGCMMHSLVPFFVYDKLPCLKLQWHHIAAWNTRAQSYWPNLRHFWGCLYGCMMLSLGVFLVCLYASSFEVARTASSHSHNSLAYYWS